MMVLVSLALATEPTSVGTKWFRSVPMEEAFGEAPLVFAGTVESIRDVAWLGGAGDSYGRAVRIRVDQEFKGHIESGVIDYWDFPFRSPFEMGQRIVVFGGPKVQQVSSYERALRSPFTELPPFSDLIIPLWDTSVVFDDPPSARLLASDEWAYQECFRSGAFVQVTSRQADGDYCTEEEWSALVAHVATLAATGSEVFVMPGAEN